MLIAVQDQNRQSGLTNLLNPTSCDASIYVRINFHLAGQLKIFINTRTSSNHGSL